ncbi:charged multivesicular body protein 7-like [Daphnia pulicaria]|uniref:charged multivesicular body protein 7-like n=1 Tax=Daphnia pulicaria TaxID=35523 RepID=UPI001EEBC50A|nr:charged multivesicular body protein 7-like [Daphnia pulicaria]
MGSSESFSSEVFKLPDCWKDDVRMTALFALPRNESLNPHDWVGKYKFWKELILEWATFNHKIMFDVEDLKKVFCRNGKYPASLNRVLDEMKKNGDVAAKDQYCYQADQSSSSWAKWGVSLVTSSVAWSWKKVMNSLPDTTETLQTFVVPSVLKERCEQILQLPIASTEEIMELEELTDEHSEIFNDDEETQLILNHLQQIGKVAIESSSDQTMIKFIVPTVKAKQSQLNNSGWSISPAKQKEKAIEITEVDRSLATLKRTEKLLNDEIDNMESEMKSLEQTARTRLKEGSRGAAKAALYRRKQLQAVYDKRNQALSNIQTMKLQLAQAKTDSKVMEAYKIGLSALKNSFGDPSMNEEKIQDTLFELETVLEQQRDIENIMSQSIVQEEGESDLEEELKNILAESEEAQAEQEEEQELVLPAVPTESPTKKEELSARLERLRSP